MIKCQQSRALTSHFESFWSIVCGSVDNLEVDILPPAPLALSHIVNSTFWLFSEIKADVTALVIPPPITENRNNVTF